MQKRTGISLIVLVITIIVMIILAGAIILTLNNSGIIDRASNAVEETNLATVKELTQMAWAEAYAGGERTEEGLKEAVDKVLSDNKVDTTKYVIEVTTKGVTVALKGPWTQQGLTVTNGSVTLEIGDAIAYDETKGGAITGLTATDWKVLGASEEGELLIMSTSDVDYLTLGYDDVAGGLDNDLDELDEAVNDWLNGAAELDSLCEPYGKGENATGARSIRVEDVDKITGYDKTTYEKGKLYEYGNNVTYSYNESNKPNYSGSNGVSGALTYGHSNGFHFYNGIEFVHVNDLTTGTSGTTFATLKSDVYYYYAPDLETIEYGSKAYTMLFGEDDTYYWLASPHVYSYTSYAFFGMRFVGYGGVLYYNLWDSSGNATSYELGVRAVVSLASDINVTGSSETGWTY